MRRAIFIMEKICGIYKITSPSGRVYIGQSRDIKERERHYKYSKCKQQPALYNSIKKYGWSNHKFEIIHRCDICELNNLEVYYIDLFQTFNNKKIGLNLKTGGEYRVMLSDESKKKIIEANLGRTPWNKGKIDVYSKETRLSMGNGRRGKKMPQESIRKMILSRTGQKRSAESRKRMSDKRIGMKFSKSHIENMRLSRIGVKNHTNKLSEQEVIDIFIASNNGVKAKVLCFKYNVRHPTIYNIKNRVKWTHVTDRITI